MISHNIPFDFKVINYLENKEDQSFLAKETPINKIPYLIADGEKIFDSRVIFNYLSAKHKVKSLSLKEENHLSVVVSLFDVSVNLFMLKRGGLDIDAPNWYLERQKARIQPSLNYLETWVDKLDAYKVDDWNYVAISLYSYLHWATSREILDLKDRPILTSFLNRFSNAPGLSETDPTAQ